MQQRSETSRSYVFAFTSERLQDATENDVTGPGIEHEKERGGFMSLDSGESHVSPRITEVNIQPVNEDRLKAFVTIVFDDNFVVHGVKIIEAGGRRFVAMPTRRNNSGQQTDVCHPINQTYRTYIEDVVLTAFDRKLEDDSLGPGLTPH